MDMCEAENDTYVCRIICQWISASRRKTVSHYRTLNLSIWWRERGRYTHMIVFVFGRTDDRGYTQFCPVFRPLSRSLLMENGCQLSRVDCICYSHG